MALFYAAPTDPQAISAIHPSAETAHEWTSAGEQLQSDGQAEINNAKQRQVVDATVDSGAAKLKSWVSCPVVVRPLLPFLSLPRRICVLLQPLPPSVQGPPHTSTLMRFAHLALHRSAQRGLTPSAVGYLSGDQSRQTQGNVEAEKAQWEYKQAASSNPMAVPVPSAEGLQGKAQSVLGMVTGDAELQKEGNVRAEKAAWRDGV
jgi:hypothetical protein